MKFTLTPSLNDSPIYPCAFTTKFNGMDVWVVSRTWEQAENEMKAKLKALIAAGTIPQPITIEI